MLRRLVARILSLCSTGFLTVCLTLFLTMLAAPVQAASKADKAAQSTSQGPRRHLANIVFAGLAGAVLGLSTLSFYGRPQDRLSNIAVGFAIGVISGTMYTTYKAATEPKDFYALHDPQAELWAYEASNRRAAATFTPHSSFVFEF